MTVSLREEPLVFDCHGDRLLGVLHHADAGVQVLGMVIVVGGPQYRAGSHRQFLQLARSVAAAGYPVLRFDLRGMGDSSGKLRRFDEAADDVHAAVGALHRRLPNLRGCVLWGLCDGASAALLCCHEYDDPRVAGLALLNPWVRSDNSRARTQVRYYYARRLVSRSFWQKLLSGKVARDALFEALTQARRAFGPDGMSAAASREGPALSYQSRMALAWKRFAGPVLLLLSGDDFTAREFIDHAGRNDEWHGALDQAQVERHDLPGANHTLTDPAHLAQVSELTLQWLRVQDSTAGACGPDSERLNQCILQRIEE